MVYFKGTLADSWALRQLVLLFTRYVVAAALLFVARLAEMSVSPAEPLRNRAAEFTFVLDEILAVLLTSLNSSANRNSGALSADKLFLFEVGVVLVGLVTVLHSSKVWILAFEAHVVRQLAHGVLLQVVVESGLWVRHSLVLVQFLELRSLNGLLNHSLLEQFLLLDFFVQDRLACAFHSLLAVGAVQVVENDSRPVVHFLNLLLRAVEVVDMTALVDHAGLLAYCSNVADRTEVLQEFLRPLAFRQLLRTLWD